MISVIGYGVWVSLRPGSGDANQIIIARIGEKTVSQADFYAYVRTAHFPKSAKELLADDTKKESLMEDFLDGFALNAKAEANGITRLDRFQKAVSLMELKLLSKMATESNRAELAEASKVSPEEVRAYYRSHANEYMEPARFSAHQLVVYVIGNPAFPQKGRTDAAAKKWALKALTALQLGKSWEEVVEKYSDERANSRKAGLIRDGRFGYFAAEVENAIRTQVIGKPGPVVKSDFGYHVIEVVSRQLEPAPRPFESVRDMLREKLTDERTKEVRQNYMEPVRKRMKLRFTETGKRTDSLLAHGAIDKSETVAYVNGSPVLESDFQWFLKDAFLPSQLRAVHAQNHARQRLLQSFVDMIVLAEDARARPASNIRVSEGFPFNETAVAF
jgi:hypothetical protein